MSSTWDSLVAEGVIKLPRHTTVPLPVIIPSAPPPPSTLLPTPHSSSASSTSLFVPLTHAKKEALRAARGCYHCRKTPRLQVGSSIAAIAAPVTPLSGYKAVAVVMPAPYDDEDNSFSLGTDDSDLATRDD
ncbi:hypothetical protein B0H19DRAFT_1060412 [Mycena capillaripes]|nr:hypothetical protein B0H19DRAFT_1060412 [Mycena capillaripes]